MALDIEEEKISELEDTAIEIIHKQAEKKLLSRNEWSSNISEFGDNFKKPKIYVIVILKL